MEKISKFKTILRAFTEESDIDQEVLDYRRSICSECPYNSKNIKSIDEIDGLVNKVRYVANESFCTACTCNIEKKTASVVSECGLAEIGQKPKWNRLVLETSSVKDVNILNHSSDIVRVDLDEKEQCITFDAGEVHEGNVIFSFGVQSSEPMYLSRLIAGCPDCTKLGYEVVNNHVFTIKVDLNTSYFFEGEFMKKIIVGYNIDNESKELLIKVKGTKIIEPS